MLVKFYSQIYQFYLTFRATLWGRLLLFLSLQVIKQAKSFTWEVRIANFWVPTICPLYSLLLLSFPTESCSSSFSRQGWVSWDSHLSWVSLGWNWMLRASWGCSQRCLLLPWLFFCRSMCSTWDLKVIGTVWFMWDQSFQGDFRDPSQSQNRGKKKS